MQASIMGPCLASTNCCLVVGRGAARALSINNDMMETMSNTICTGGPFCNCHTASIECMLGLDQTSFSLSETATPGE